LSAELATWHDEHLLDHRRRLRTAMFVSLAVHGLILALFAASPPRPTVQAPEYLAVELVAAPSGADTARKAAPTARSAPKSPPPPPEPAATEPPPAPAPAPPVAKAPVQVLPEETPGRIRKVTPKPPAPKVVAKAAPKPEPVRRRPRREQALSYEDAMASLDDELGVDDTADLMEAAASEPAASSDSDSESESQARPGIKVSPEQLAWDREVFRMIQSRFPNFGRFSGRGLVAQLEVVVSASGDLSGEPRLVGTSGDLDFDRMAIAVVERAAPLPPPPNPGARRLSLTSDKR